MNQAALDEARAAAAAGLPEVIAWRERKKQRCVDADDRSGADAEQVKIDQARAYLDEVTR